MRTKAFSRGSGILLSIASLPSTHGTGDLGEGAYRFVDLLVDLRQRYWQVLSINPMTVGRQPVSGFAGDECLIDLEDLVRQELLTGAEVSGVNWSSLDETAVRECRMRMLRQAYKGFDPENRAYIEYCAAEAWLDDYSLFMALKTFSGNRPWMQWDEEIRTPQTFDCAGYRERLQEECSFYKFCQYEFYRQWQQLKQYANMKGIRIIGEMPFYMACDSADVWSEREQFQTGTEGSPECVLVTGPELQEQTDRNCRNPLYNWEEQEKSGFDWWKRRLRLAARLYDDVRIADLTGAVRYYSIPCGRTVRAGKWNRGPGKRLTDAMEEVLGDCGIIADIRSPAVPAAKRLLQKCGWSGTKILLDAFDGNTANEDLPHNYTDTGNVVYVGSYDGDTIEDYFKDKTDYELAFLFVYLGIHSREEITDAFIRLAYSSIADIAIIRMEDILKLKGTIRSWRWNVDREVLTDERRSWLRTLSTVYRR